MKRIYFFILLITLMSRALTYGAYGAETTETQVLSAVDLIKRSLPLGALKGFRRIPFTFAGKSLMVNIPESFPKCNQVSIPRADHLYCYNAARTATLEVSRVPIRNHYMTDLSREGADIKGLLTEFLDRRESLVKFASPPLSGSVEKLFCKNLAAAYNIIGFLSEGAQCRLTQRSEQRASHHILVQKNGGDVFDFALWYDARRVPSYHTLLPMVIMHSLRDANEKI